MAKVAKWGDEVVTALVEGYDGEASEDVRAEQVADLMDSLEKSKREVVGKLVSLKLYVAPEKKVAAKKDEGPTKKEILRAIEDTGFDVSGFEGATKDALNRLQAQVA